MKLTLERAPFLAAAARAQRVVERKNTIPILANVVLRAKDDRLVITASDLDLEITQSIPAEIASPGSTTVPASMLHDILRKLPDGAQVQLDLGADQRALTLRAGRSRFALQALPDADFPAFSGVKDGHQIDLPGKDLAAAIARVEFAISNEETRYYLNGIYFHERAGKLALVATDGHRLSLYSLEVGADLPKGFGVIVPTKAVSQLKALATAADKSAISLAVSSNRLAATFSDVSFTTKLIDGTFPDYARILPVGNDRKALLKAKDLSSAVDRVGTLAHDHGRAMRFGFAPAGLELSVRNPDAGEASEIVEIEFDGEEIPIGFNTRYTLDVIASMGGDEIEIALADSGSPALFRRPDEKDALCVLMPMRV